MKHLLIEAKSEIERLRRRNEILSAKVEVMDLFACVLHTAPATYNPPQCVDIAWSLQKGVEQLEREEDTAEMNREQAAKEIATLKATLEDANGLCRSAMMIAERGGEANWPTFTDRLRESLERQHAVMHPPENAGQHPTAEAP